MEPQVTPCECDCGNNTLWYTVFSDRAVCSVCCIVMVVERGPRGGHTFGVYDLEDLTTEHRDVRGAPLLGRV
jgi:hypothetical protein